MPTISVKDAGIWKDVKNIYVKKDGVWTNVLEGYVNDNGTWKPFFYDVFSFSIASNQTNADLRSLALAAGWNGVSPVAATINSGIYISSNTTSGAALTVSGSFPTGVSLTNNGYIIGMGGNGGNGNIYETEGGFPGAPGGTAIAVSSPLSITNNQTIAGGGGGGGGGGPIYYTDGVYSWAGGGGGGGRSSLAANTSGGAAGLNNFPSTARYPTNGAIGTSSSAGSGGLGGLSPNGAYGGGNGGAGGDWGQAGSAGGRGFIHDGGSYIGYFGGAGGAAGNAVTGNSNVTWIATGTRLGGIS